jgi:glycosyltransferase involved in cell wall biosynthesis
MRIAMIDPSLFTLPYDHHLCRALHGRGHGVTLFTRPYRVDEPQVTHCYGKADHFYRLTEGLVGRLLPSPAKLLCKGLEHASGMASLIARLAALKPDVVHFQWLPIPLLDRFYLNALRRIAPIALTVHDSRGLLAPSSALQLAGWNQILKTFDRLVVHLDESRKQLVTAGIDGGRVSVIPHGVLTYDEAPGRMGPPAGDGSRDRRILAFGAIKPYKGLDNLIRSYSMLPPEIRETTKLWVVGEPHTPQDELVSLARTLGVADRIDWDLRYVPDEEVPSILRAADVLAFPYRRIDASGVLMLSMPFGKPIVATRVGCFGELLEDGDSALLAPPDNPIAFAAQLRRALEDEPLAERIGRRSRELSESTYSWDSIAETTEQAYTEAAELHAADMLRLAA